MVRNGTSVQASVNGEERLSAALSADGALSATILYLGHVPEPGRRRRQAEERGAQDQFKGSIQDVRVGGEELYICVWLWCCLAGQTRAARL